jgi:hypothetical protein
MAKASVKSLYYHYLSGPVCALMRLVGIVTNTVDITTHALKIDV